MKTEKEIIEEIKKIEIRRDEFLFEDHEESDEYWAQLQLYDDIISKLKWVLE